MQSAPDQFLRSNFREQGWQIAGTLLCVLFGAAIVANVQLGGESMWFWYATLFHHGVQLYADLHFTLQPFYVLETDGWMRLVGQRCIPYEGLALIHVLLLTVGMLLVLRESRWPDWQKAFVLCGAFVAIIQFQAYRFDDFHVIADSCYLYALALLLRIARTSERRRSLWLAAVLGGLAGVAITNRVTDGGLLFLAAGLSLPFVEKNRRFLSILIYGGTAAVCWLMIVHLTGDSMRDYLANSIFKAASAKGGTSHVLAGPLAGLRDTFARVGTGGKREIFFLTVVCAIGAALQRFWRRSVGFVVAAEVGFVLLAAVVHLHVARELMSGSLIAIVSMFLQPVTYLLCAAIPIRMLWCRSRGVVWDSREVILLIPLASLLSAALSQANGTSNSTNTIALLFLLAPALWPEQPRWSWLPAFVVALVALVAVSGVPPKVRSPYDWGSSVSQAMFTHRQWYRHPLYGAMYMDVDQLRFNQSICATINESDSAHNESDSAQPQLLSIPFPYANYFCGISPWNNYVQTWYDTVTPATIAVLMQQLQSAPPQWILYQRQPGMIYAHEVEYNHGQPIAHRYLDELILREVATGQWRVASETAGPGNERWYLIETRH